VEAGVWQANATAAVTAAAGHAELVVRRDQQTSKLLVELAQQRLERPAAVVLGVVDLARGARRGAVTARLPVLRAGTGLRHLLVPVGSAAELGRPSGLWARVEFTGQRAVLVRLCGMAERVLTGRLARRPPSAAPA
jgi:predicted PhzF superfamily epimerase YddE/YHI9